MTRPFEAEAWIDRLSNSLANLTKAQSPLFGVFQRRSPRKITIPIGRREEKPFPLDDLRDFYARLRHGQRLEEGTDHRQLHAALDAARHALLSHPQLEWVAVSGRTVGENDFWMQILNTGSSISAGDLIAGLMARASEVSVEGFRVAAREMNAFLRPVEDDAAGVLGILDESCHAVLFYGLSLAKRLNVEDGMWVLPPVEVSRFVGRDLLEEVAPSPAFYRCEQIGAVVTMCRWRPTFSQRGSLDEPSRLPPTRFFNDSKVLLDLISVSHREPVAPLATISDCIDHRAARLFGHTKLGSGFYQTYSAEGFGGLVDPPELVPERFDEACELFRKRLTPNYQKMSRFVGLLAKALKSSNDDDKIVDVAKALEGMYQTPKRDVLRTLKRRVAGVLGSNEADQEGIERCVQAFYKTRSKIVHGELIEGEPFRKGAAFVRGLDLAQRTLLKFIREGAPNDWHARRNPT